MCVTLFFFFFFFNDTATTEIYTLSLHDALPISSIVAQQSKVERKSRSNFATTMVQPGFAAASIFAPSGRFASGTEPLTDRKSTRLNSSHSQISYAVFCLKKKNTTQTITSIPTWR